MAEEVEALRAIYDADFRTISEEPRMFSITIQPATVGNTLHLELLVCVYMEVSLHGTILDPRPFVSQGVWGPDQHGTACELHQ